MFHSFLETFGISNFKLCSIIGSFNGNIWFQFNRSILLEGASADFVSNETFRCPVSKNRPIQLINTRFLKYKTLNINVTVYNNIKGKSITRREPIRGPRYYEGVKISLEHIMREEMILRFMKLVLIKIFFLSSIFDINENCDNSLLFLFFYFPHFLRKFRE